MPLSMQKAILGSAPEMPQAFSKHAWASGNARGRCTGNVARCSVHARACLGRWPEEAFSGHAPSNVGACTGDALSMLAWVCPKRFVRYSVPAGSCPTNEHDRACSSMLGHARDAPSMSSDVLWQASFEHLPEHASSVLGICHWHSLSMPQALLGRTSGFFATMIQARSGKLQACLSMPRKMC
jgi:hypothetical protein